MNLMIEEFSDFFIFIVFLDYMKKNKNFI